MHIQLNEQNQYLRDLPTGNVEFSPTVFQPAHTLTPEQMDQFRVRPLVHTDQPAFDPITHGVRAAAPVQVDGVWTQQWQVEDLSVAEVQDNLQKQALEIKRRVVQETQNRLDNFANSRNYDGILSACTYATSNIPKFAAEGQVAVNLRDATWAALYQIFEEVQAGQREAPTGFSDIEPLLPPLEWPI